ncbi:dual-specificity RNA methyltransferase RlmN [Striga asiatica]|uniref:Dual-specificity RNA methyltransferase RlmN n=1 Tax=Striga asiatica TaxID=4170 RepID=A0A5A7Q3V6_STRAF|nr:dual-specificity RNA methyltransferase RlmN [Striga asiatica]
MKDTVKARQNLEDMKIRKELHLTKRSDGKYNMPVACYVMNKKEKQEFCEFLKSVKFPDGYASNISRCVSSRDQKISGFKSHDFHVLLQRIIPTGIRGSLNKEVCDVLAELGHFFQRLCCQKLRKTELEQMKEDIVIILCKLEKIYPPAFFDVMVHLSIHLPNEALLGGPVQFRWMYPIERFLGDLKQTVHNKAHPEGSVAKAYIAKECLTFCSMYLPSFVELSEEEFNMTQWFVFQNCEEVEPYLEPGIQKDGNIVSVRVSRKWYENDSCILANQARQVFYIKDPKLGNDWLVVQPFQHRHVYDVDEMQDEEMDVDDILAVEDEVYQANDANDVLTISLDEIELLNRKDIDPEDIADTIIESSHEVSEVVRLDDIENEDELDDDDDWGLDI